MCIRDSHTTPWLYSQLRRRLWVNSVCVFVSCGLHVWCVIDLGLLRTPAVTRGRTDTGISQHGKLALEKMARSTPLVGMEERERERERELELENFIFQGL